MPLGTSNRGHQCQHVESGACARCRHPLAGRRIQWPAKMKPFRDLEALEILRPCFSARTGLQKRDFPHFTARLRHGA